MKNTLKDYVPFEHDNLDYKNNLISIARDHKRQTTFEHSVSSIVLYANLVEYLTNDLHRNLRQIVYLLSYHGFQGVVFPKGLSQKVKPKTLGVLISELESYEFPDKIDFVRVLGVFNSARNDLLHKLMEKKGEQEINKIDKTIAEVQEYAEEILEKYNVITEGIKNAWNRIVDQTKNVTATQNNEAETNKS